MIHIIRFLESAKFLHNFSNYYFYIFFVLIFYKVLVQSTSGVLYGDFWEHSAVIQALIVNPFSPIHPLYALEAPHAFISPYHLFVAFFVKVTNLGLITSLNVFGVLNFCLLIFGFKFFIKGFVTDKAQYTLFYALLFILFLWGNQPWGFSGFFYFELLTDVLPYPSTFATALSLIGLGIGFELKRPTDLFNQLLLIFISTIVLLCHPLTFIFLSSGLLCQAVFSKQKISFITNYLVIFAIAFGLACFWPYYSILALLTGAGDVYHASNQIMYSDVLIRIWPILVLTPLLWSAFKHKAAMPIFLHLLVLLTVYFFGWFTSKYSYGRVITFIVILVQILLATQFARFELKLSQTYPYAILTYRLFLGGALLWLASSWLYPTMTRSLTILNSLVSGRTVSNQITYKNLTFLSNHIENGSVVFSDIDTSWLVPSFGGKVIGALHVQAFVADDEQRRFDLLDFYAKDATTAKRQSILQKYKPDYFLIDKKKYAGNEWKQLLNELGLFSKTTQVYQNDQYLLFRFN